MRKKVLDVGQCGPDHASIRRALAPFNVDIVQAHDGPATLAALQKGDIALVLINRKLDHDYTDGIEIIRAMKAAPETASVPVMLVTNYPEHQEEAVALGALHGFGKLELGSKQVHERLAAVLSQ